jgi:hypothetical protein
VAPTLEQALADVERARRSLEEPVAAAR